MLTSWVSEVTESISTYPRRIKEKSLDCKKMLAIKMGCVYRKSRNHEELKEIMSEAPIGEIYLPSDVPRMCGTISKATKTCLAFKILAAGRTCDSSEQVRKAFEFVLGHIKPTDAVIVGMYPRYTDQIKENADFVRMYG